MSAYDDYADAEREAGREPLTQAKWRAERMKDGREKAAAARAQVDAAPAENVEPTPENMPALPVPEEPEFLIFWGASRFLVEVMQAGGKTVINGQVVIQPHKTIEFIEHHWTADMSDPEDREKAEWLMQCKDFRKGEVVLVPQVRKTSGPTIQTGPRTSHTPKTRHETIERPSNPRETIEALSAPLHN